MKKVLICAIFVLIQNVAFCQKTEVVNVSVIVSDTAGCVLKDVAIYNSKQKVIGLTNNSGTTVISVRYNDIVMFSHISYEQKKVKISDETVFDKNGKDCKMIVMLQERTNILPEVDIVENAPHLAYQNKEVWVVDYKVGKEGITAITTTGRDSYLLHLSFEQDTLSIRQINKKYENIKRDVFGNIHLIGPDSTYQIYSDGGKMQLLYGTTRKKYNETFAPVAALTDSILVTRQSYYSGQEIVFFKVNRNNKKSEFLCDVYSETKEMAKNWYRDNIRLMRATIHDTSLFYNPYKKSEDYYDIKMDLAKQLMLGEIYVPSFNIDDYIYIFDFQKDAIYKYDIVGNYIERLDIVFHRSFRNSINKDWNNNIILDVARNECYAQFTHDGIVTLKKINLKDGNISDTYTLDAHVFPSNIQVYDGSVFYQFIDVRKTVGRDCRSLYKMQLK